MTTSIVFSSIFLVIGFFLQSWVFHLLTRLLKLSNTTFKKAVMVMGLQWVATMSIWLLFFGTFSLFRVQTNLFVMLVWAIAFIAFHFILQKFYKSSLGKNIVLYLLLYISVMILFILFIMVARIFVFEPIHMRGDSMEPTLQEGEYMLFSKFDKEYMKDDIVIFPSPTDNSLLIRKIVGLPGERIELSNDEVIELGEDELFVIAEKQSEDVEDSYDFGAVNVSSIRSSYWFSFYSPDN